MATLISTPQDLSNIRNNLSGSYELINDIDMASWGNFTPIGNSSNRFTGSINGKGYKIKNLTINQSYVNVGLFGNAENVTIQNLAVENASVTSNNYNYVGVIVGYSTSSNISNVYTTGTVSGQYGVGGLVGYFGGTIENSYSHVNATGKGRVGGLVGNVINTDSFIRKTYSTELVTVTPDPTLYNGGLVGSGYDNSNVTDSYYDIETSGQTISAGGTGKTTTEMKTQSTYTDWDFTTVWGISGDYPYLQVFGLPSALPKIETVEVVSFSLPIQSNVDKTINSTKQIESYTDLIQTNSKRYTATLRNVSTYLPQIDSNATQSHRSVRTGGRNVNSFISPIYSTLHKESKTVTELLSFVKPLEADVSVLYPLMDIPVYAVVSTLKSHSMASYEHNMSEIYYVVNPSFSEVIK